MTEKELKGISGWLGLYVWFGLIGCPIVLLIYIYENMAILPRIIIPSLFLVLNIYACFKLLKRQPRAVGFVKTLLVVWLFYVGGFVASNLIRHGLDVGKVTHLFDWVLDSVPRAGYLAYFMRSRRVRNTFPEG